MVAEKEDLEGESPRIECPVLVTERLVLRPPHADDVQDIARLANNPRILLADEPTGNLDPRTSGGVFDALVNLVRSEGLAALIATHNIELAAKMDRALVLHEGRLIDGGKLGAKG